MRIAVSGRNGRVGKEVVKCVDEDAEAVLASLEEADVIIDFSHPSRTRGLLDLKKPLVMGTTGHEDFSEIEEASKEIPLLYAANFSLGVLMMRQMTTMLSKFLGDQASFDLIEEHHEKKVDAPSGTALSIEKALGKEMPIHSIRMKDSFGAHELHVGLPGEQLTISHRALGRALYARMALESAKIIIHKPPKLYSLEELFLC
ncbi:MAG: dihydrodipicolinate reductase C-terminal domain-containing protein [Candidatus Algichlamydia australiensis]|nr:dihydrodipicolinate reductase C-terminal domain-containing protein [Chlamydiales bacterium]